MSTLWTPSGYIDRRFPGDEIYIAGISLNRIGDAVYGGHVYWRWFDENSKLTVIASMDATPHGDLLHVSVSYPHRDPDWDIIKAVREVFYSKNIDVMMVLPRESDYVNEHPHCFHMWQTPREWGIQ